MISVSMYLDLPQMSRSGEKDLKVPYRPGMTACDILNQEFERTYGRGATLHCVGSGEAVTGGIRIARDPEPAASGSDAGEDEAPSRSGLVQRIVELFDGEVLDPGTQGSGAT